MYPERELRRLGARKAVLIMRIGLRRAECAEAAANVARPIEWLDRARDFLEKIKPFAMIAAVPIGFLTARAASRPMRVLGSIARWAPLLFGNGRGL